MPYGTLFVVATPIGNLGDLSHRAVAVLRDADLILCEDTRRTRKLLKHYDIRRPIFAYHDFNETAKAKDLVERLLSGMNLALVSDAGTPTISDPGYRLVRSCRQHDIPVVPVPGPSAGVAALSVSGLPTDQFQFVGFLPSLQDARRRKLASLKQVSCTLVFYEAPHRIRETLTDIQEVLGDREVFVARELTKIHEDSMFGQVGDVASRVREKGEVVIVLSGSDATESATEAIDLDRVPRQELLKIAAQRLGVSRRKLYEALYRKKK